MDKEEVTTRIKESFLRAKKKMAKATAEDVALGTKKGMRAAKKAMKKACKEQSEFSKNVDKNKQAIEELEIAYRGALHYLSMDTDHFKIRVGEIEITRSRK